jgi:hypothetical protein
MSEPFMLRQAVRATAYPLRVQHERIGSCGRIIFPFVLSLSKDRTGAPEMGGL